jgi:hypothetical protein
MKKDTIDFINKHNLQFFGAVNASISHELKNILAIISETAGFLDDLTQLSKQGKKFELSMLENCSNSIVEEIERGFDTIRQMNKFAHSVDDSIKTISIADTLALTVKLSSFLSYAKKVRLDENSADDITITTSPFLLQNLIYKTLRALYRAMDAKDELTIEYSGKEFSYITLGFSSKSLLDLKNFPDEEINNVADALKTEFIITDTGIKLNIQRTNDTLTTALTD